MVGGCSWNGANPPPPPGVGGPGAWALKAEGRRGGSRRLGWDPSRQPRQLRGYLGLSGSGLCRLTDGKPRWQGLGFQA